MSFIGIFKKDKHGFIAMRYCIQDAGLQCTCILRKKVSLDVNRLGSTALRDFTSWQGHVCQLVLHDVHELLNFSENEALPTPFLLFLFLINLSISTVALKPIFIFWFQVLKTASLTPSPKFDRPARQENSSLTVNSSTGPKYWLAADDDSWLLCLLAACRGAENGGRPLCVYFA